VGWSRFAVVVGADTVETAVHFDRPLAGGMKGLRDTARAMSAVACLGSRDSVIVELANDLRSNRILTTLQKIFTFVVDNVHYTLDPAEVELVKTPTRTLLDKTGDCDDFSTLIAALVRACEIPVQFAVVRTPGHSFFNHVFPEASTDDGATWIALDGTLDNPAVGKVAPKILSRTTFKFRCPQ